jgi:hypothetical protein
MQAQPGTAFVAARRKEGVERLPLHVRRHSGPVVGKNDLDIVAAARPRRIVIAPDRPSAKAWLAALRKRLVNIWP